LVLTLKIIQTGSIFDLIGFHYFVRVATYLCNSEERKLL